MSDKFISGSGGGRRRKKRRQPTMIVHHVASNRGGGSTYTPPRAPVRTPDNLNSKQYATFLDLVSVGPIEGFPSASEFKNPPIDTNTGLPVTETEEEEAARLQKYEKAILKDIYLNDTPILREDADIDSINESDYNYTGYEIDWRLGEPDQTYIPDFADVEDDEVVDSNVAIRQGLPRTRYITDPDVTSVRVTIALPTLQRFTTYGDVYGSSVELSISTRYTGEAEFTEQIRDTITGRSGDQYIRDYVIRLDGGTFPCEVRVERISDDSSDENTQNDIFWTTLTLIKEQKYRYPYSALVALRLDAEEHGSIPERSYRVRGIKVKIPTGVTVDQQTGRIVYPQGFIWDGQFQANPEWTSCPAWILYAILTSKRDGFGDYITEENLDRWTFFECSKYANELCDDGRGSQEPRFSCNGVIQNADEAYKVVNDLCSVMRVMPFWNTGTVTISQDRPRDVSFLFNPTNVTAEGFKYSSSSLKTRHTVAIVSYFDKSIRDINYEIQEDTQGIAKYGLIPIEIKAVFCTSRAQAMRLAKWLLYTESQEGKVVEFKTSIDAGTVVRPGAVISISDPTKTSDRLAGRIIGFRVVSSEIHLKLDNDLSTLDSNLNRISFLSKSGISQTVGFTVVSPSTTGASSWLANSSEGWTSKAWPATDEHYIVIDRLTSSNDDVEEFRPVVDAVYMLEPQQLDLTTIRPTKWRVLSVIDEGDGIYGISALSYRDEKYAFVEDGEAIPEVNDTHIDPAPDPPENLKATEGLYREDNQIKSKITVAWDFVDGADHYQLQYRQGDTNWQIREPIKTNEYVITNPDIGDYEFRVYSVSPSSLPSRQFISISFTALGKVAQPKVVSDLSAISSGSSVFLSWEPSDELDVINGGSVLIKFQPLLDINQLDWSSGILVGEVAGGSTQVEVENLTGYFMAKYRDSTGNESPSFTAVSSEFIDDDRFHVLSETFHDGVRKINPGQSDEQVFTADPWSGGTFRAFPTRLSSGQAAFVLASAVDLDKNPFEIDVQENFDYNGPPYSYGSYKSPHQPYEFDHEYHFEYVYTAQLGALGSTPVDERYDLSDSWVQFDTFEYTANVSSYPIFSSNLSTPFYSSNRLRGRLTTNRLDPGFLLRSAYTSRPSDRFPASQSSNKFSIDLQPDPNLVDLRTVPISFSILALLSPGFLGSSRIPTAVTEATLDIYAIKRDESRNVNYTGARTTVNFNQCFFAVPSVFVETSRTTETADVYPRVSNITTDSFDVEVYKRDEVGMEHLVTTPFLLSYTATGFGLKRNSPSYYQVVFDGT